ncbi:MAG: NUDIX hydrolase [Smithellaceae bacterium]|nr:NUDIX hydrolase [Smithellaceae bacterium]
MVDINNLGYGKSLPLKEPDAAATVILLREMAETPWEVFLLRRHAKQNFMGGAHVFPGGRLEEADMDPAIIPNIFPGELAENLLLREEGLAPDLARGLFVAAIRETFEEAGIFLGCGPSGEPLQSAEGPLEERLSSCRQDLHKGNITLLELLRRENLRLDFRLLAPYSHWITPAIETRRFDTRFFLARIPPGQRPLHDSRELTASAWFSPEAALTGQDRGEITLMPPTLKTLEELSHFPSTAELFRAASRKEMPVIMPEVIADGEQVGIILPHDREYRNPVYRQAPRPGECSRIMLTAGRWQRIGNNDTGE